ncbi:hypothetical protein IFO70_25045 [Phormidium tenue FACHB-886]|nr:hypothetical protein [Phormidium tenue FACHB-886]
MRKWLQPLMDEYLEAVQPLQYNDSNKAIALAWAEWLKCKWAAHGISTLDKQRPLMTEVRNYLKQALGAGHIALETMNFTPEQWTAMNHTIAARAAAQNEAQVILSPETVNAIVTRATTLLQSRQWSDIAAALAVLTGRRSTEVLKTATFTPATPYSVLFTGALKRKGEQVPLRFEIPTLTQAEYVLKATDKLRRILPTQDKSIEQINQYSHAVAAACDKHFADLVPTIEGRDNLYTHLFRKVYATIATYFYCPQWVDEAEFRAEIQGHFAGHASMSMAARRTIASDRHYRSYLIADEQGNMRKGIRLEWRDVQVIAAFRRDKQNASAASTSSLLEGIPASTSSPDLTQSLAPKPIAMPRTSSKSPKSTKQAAQPDLNAIKQDLEELPPRISRPELQVADLERMQSLMAAQGRKGTIKELFTALLDRYEQLKNQSDESQKAEAQPVELEQEQGQKQSNELIADEQTIRWFTTEIDRLRARIQELEKQQAHPGTDDGVIAQLRQENATLQLQLQQTQSRLEAIGQFLNGGNLVAASSPVSSISGVSTTRGDSSSPSPSPSATSNDKGPSKSPSNDKDEHSARAASRRQATQLAGELDADVVQALERLMAYNNAQGRTHQERWVISVPVMKDLLKQIGKATQPKIEAVLKARASEIEAHHQEHGLGERHNRVHQGQSVSDVVTLR